MYERFILSPHLSCFHLLPFSLPGKFHVILEIGVAKELSVSLAISMCFKSHHLHQLFRQFMGYRGSKFWALIGWVGVAHSDLGCFPLWDLTKTYHPVIASSHVRTLTSHPWAKFSPSPVPRACTMRPIPSRWSAHCCAWWASVSSQVSGLAPWRARLALWADRQAFLSTRKWEYIVNTNWNTQWLCNK